MSDPLGALVCPACRGELVRLPERIDCRACGRSFPQPQDYVDLLIDDGLRHGSWSRRQEEMTAWYADLFADPERAERALARDLDPLAGHLARIEGSVIDIGGGSGDAARYLVGASGYVSVDPGAEWAQASWSATPAERGAEPPAERGGAPPAFVRASGEHLPFADHSFDGALALWSLNHAASPPEVVAEVARVLRPGGRWLLVLEDMRPSWRDLAASSGLGARPRALWRPSRATMSIAGAKALSHVGLRPWRVQSDHLLIRERDLRRRLAGWFEILERRWIGAYLTFVVARRGVGDPLGSFSRPETTQNVT